MKLPVVTLFGLGLRLDKSPLRLCACTLSLVFFALVLTKVETEFAGRAYAAYTGFILRRRCCGWRSLSEHALVGLTLSA